MGKNNWELVDLRVFCAVARRSSFTGASVDLGISVAYVAKRIAHLEQVLQTPLFLRTTRRMSITGQGEVVYNWAKKVLAAADELNQEVAQTRQTLTGSLKISTSHRLGSLHIAPILAKLQRAHPGLEIWLELVDRRVDLLAEGFDLDVRVGEVQEPHWVAVKMADSARILCAHKDYLSTHGPLQVLSDLTRHDCLMFRDRDRPFSIWKLQGPQGEERVQVTGPLGANQSAPILAWAEQGLGIALLSQWDVASALKEGRLERVLPAYCQPAPVFAVMPTRSSQSAKLQMCLRFLRDHLNEGPWALDLKAGQFTTPESG
jgi:LysR family transcriptional activator of dmlA